MRGSPREVSAEEARCEGGPLGPTLGGWTWRTPRSLAFALVLLFGPSLWQAPLPPAVCCGTPAARVGPGNSLRPALQSCLLFQAVHTAARPLTRKPHRRSLLKTLPSLPVPCKRCPGPRSGFQRRSVTSEPPPLRTLHGTTVGPRLQQTESRPGSHRRAPGM